MVWLCVGFERICVRWEVRLNFAFEGRCGVVRGGVRGWWGQTFRRALDSLDVLRNRISLANDKNKIAVNVWCTVYKIESERDEKNAFIPFEKSLLITRSKSAIHTVLAKSALSIH
jgi:hypothetical protein